MAWKRPGWRALRPILLAGAAGITWLTLSCSPASADSPVDSPSLPEGTTGTVLSLVQGAATSVPAPAPASPAAAPGPAQSVASPLSSTVDDAIAGVPVVANVVPQATVSSVAVPAAHTVDSFTAVAVQVVAPAAESVPALDPVVTPVSDLLAGSSPVALPLPTLDTVPARLPVAGSTATAADQPSPVDAPSAAADGAPVTAIAPAQLQAPGSRPGTAPAIRLAGIPATTSVTGPHQSSDPASGHTLPLDPAHLPDGIPAVPGSGSGSAGASGGPPGATAWLSVFFFGFDSPGLPPAGEASGHIPAPVSFDPGSSPD